VSKTRWRGPAVTLGNEADEYLEREPLNDYHQSLFSAEISNGERSLRELAIDDC
jgi:hypothetical protein